jgi:asparagine synthase (glutamine-hydrolysing)
MGAAAGIENRVPLLDHVFVEFAAHVPPSWKLRGATGKYLIKKVAEQSLPHDFVFRKKFGRFPTPFRVWLQDAGMQPLLRSMTDSSGFLASVTDAAYVRELIARHQNGVENATDRIWRLLNLHLWGEAYLTGRRPSDVPDQTGVIAA